MDDDDRTCECTTDPPTNAWDAVQTVAFYALIAFIAYLLITSGN
jgi:hypothetical protein